MKFKKLGTTDIDVSLICLGSMTWGEQNTEEEGFAQMDMATDYGINFFDVAEMYPIPPSAETCSRTEEIMGNWLASRQKRDDLVIATKVTGRSSRNAGLGHIRDGARLNREHIFKAIEGSLKRLKTDYIDLYQVHWPERDSNFFGKLDYLHSEDDGVPIEETLDALYELVDQGKIRHIGVSNESAWGMSEYIRLADAKSKNRIVSIQNPYSLLNRTFEVGCSEFSMREDIGLLAYSPLAFGKLSGKYLNGAKPEGARLTLYDRFQRYEKVNVEPATEAYVKLAQQHDLTPVQLALAFVNSRDFVASNIIGATNLVQLKENIETVDIVLDESVLDGIRDIHARFPNPAP